MGQLFYYNVKLYVLAYIIDVLLPRKLTTHTETVKHN